MMFRLTLVLFSALVLVGCDTDPPTRVQLPTTIRPNPTPEASADGSIYRANGSTAFEQRQLFVSPDSDFTGAKFGSAVTISQDERWMYVAAPGKKNALDFVV